MNRFGGESRQKFERVGVVDVVELRRHNFALTNVLEQFKL